MAVYSWFELSYGSIFPECCSPGAFFGTEYDFRFLHNVLRGGIRVDYWDENHYIRCSKLEYDGEPDDALNCVADSFVFSAKLKRALIGERVGQKDVQYLPVRVIRFSGEEVRGFSVANILSLIPALDYEHSVLLNPDKPKYDPETGELNIINVWQAALRRRALVGHDVIRLEEVGTVFVSARFARVFRRLDCRGARLKKVRTV